jgi:hypothetical protein
MGKRAFVGIGIVGGIAGIVRISLGVVNLNNAHQQVIQSDHQVKGHVRRDRCLILSELTAVRLSECLGEI